jgi:hypothetical protein
VTTPSTTDGEALDDLGASVEHVGPFGFAAVARVSTQSELIAVRLRSSYTGCTVDADDVPDDWSSDCCARARRAARSTSSRAGTSWACGEVLPSAPSVR